MESASLYGVQKGKRGAMPCIAGDYLMFKAKLTFS